MRRVRYWQLALSVSVGCAVLGQLGTSAAGAATNDLCGTTLTESIHLERNVRCQGDGLRVGADGIEIDLGGHAIIGSGTGTGIIVADPAASVTIANGTIRGFETDISISSETFVRIATRLTQVNLRDAATAVEFGGGSLTIERGRISSPIDNQSAIPNSVLDVSNSRFMGVSFMMHGFAPSRFVDNDFIGGGISASEMDSLTITGNRFKGAATAVSLFASNRDTISGNRFTDNDVGLELSFSLDRGNSITDNVFARNHGVGAIIGEAGTLDGTDISDNAFIENGAAGLWVRDTSPAPSGSAVSGLPATVTGNRFLGNGFDPGTWVDENKAILNDGLHIVAMNGAPAVVADNVAIGNAGQGIEAIDVTDGGGNRARNNGGDCVGVAC